MKPPQGGFFVPDVLSIRKIPEPYDRLGGASHFRSESFTFVIFLLSPLCD